MKYFISFLLFLLLIFQLSKAVDINWAYNSDSEAYLSPSTWKEKYTHCGRNAQSPINIEYQMMPKRIYPFVETQGCRLFEWYFDDKKLTSLEWNYKRSANDICRVTGFGDDSLDLLKFLVRSPSEHLIKGKQYEAEFSFVFSSNSGKNLAILSLLVSVDDDADSTTSESIRFFDELMGAIKNREDGQIHDTIELSKSYADLLEGNEREWFNYQGSLTTPPCSEIVDWWVSRDSIGLTTAQITDLQQLQNNFYRADGGKNNREVQDLHGRQVRPLEYVWAYTSYNGKIKPQDWYEKYPKCAGDYQSPINIPFTRDVSNIDLIEPTYNLNDCSFFQVVEEFNKGKKWIPRPIDGRDDIKCEVIGVASYPFTLEAIYLFHPSEHRINGEEHEFEIQFHHTAKSGSEKVVLAHFLKPDTSGKRNSFISDLFDGKEDLESGSSYQDLVSIGETKWFNYHGSSTMPPCNENVDWWISNDLIYGDMYLDLLLTNWVYNIELNGGKNNRPIQGLHGREIRPLKHDFGFNADDGYLPPEYWYLTYPECGFDHQSPISIPYTGDMDDLKTTSDAQPEFGANECHDFKFHVDYEKDNYFEWISESTSCTAKGSSDTEFTFKYFDIRHPSEHEIYGFKSDAEIQFVYSAHDGNDLLIFGIPFNVSIAESPFLKEILQSIEDGGQDVTFTENFLTVIDPNGDTNTLDKWFQYYGSITYPPCTENTDWWISPIARDMTQDQLDKLVNLQKKFRKSNDGKNNRPIQPVNGRDIRPMTSDWAYHGYNGALGPDNWYLDFPECKNNLQSPLDIPYTGLVGDLTTIYPKLTVSGCAEFTWHYDLNDFELHWSYMKQTDDQCFGRGTAAVDFQLYEIQMHHPAGHRINGKEFDAEIQFVHKGNGGRNVMIVAVLVEVVTDAGNNILVTDLLKNIGDGETETSGSTTLSQSYSDFVHAQTRKWFNYEGSMTIPPCTENVDWWVSPEAQSIPQVQLDKIHELQLKMKRASYGYNNRPLQDPYGRPIYPLDHTWAYTESNGYLYPSVWYKDYPTCGGMKQSPIDISTKIDNNDLQKLNLKLQVSGCNYFEWFNDYSYVNLEWVHRHQEGDSCKAIGTSATAFDLVEFEIKSPAEHQINGQIYDAEVQFIHSANGGRDILIISILVSYSIDESDSDEFIANLISTFSSGRHGYVTLNQKYTDFINGKHNIFSARTNTNADAEESNETNTEYEGKDFNNISEDIPWYNYEGSSTKPPCKENVDWWIRGFPQTISKSQLEFLQQKHASYIRNEHGYNSRPIQAANGREIRPLSHRWAYNDENGGLGPEQWYQDYPLCGHKEQSPIDIIYIGSYLDIEPLHLVIDATECDMFTFSAKTSDVSIHINPIDSSKCKARGRADRYFNLQEIRFHLSAEHTIDSREYEGEIQFVHEVDEGSELLIISILLEIDDEHTSNNFVKGVMDKIYGSDERVGELDLSKIMSYDDFINDGYDNSHNDSKRRWFNYHGSTTTPPCTENVDWWVSPQTVKINHVEYDHILAIISTFERGNHGKNNRETKPLNGREIRPLHHDFAYHPRNGYLEPANWVHDYAYCGADRQSPIDIPYMGKLQDLTELQPTLEVTNCRNFKWSKDDYTTTKLGWKLDRDENDRCVVKGRSDLFVPLTRFEVHTPSEHSIHGIFYDAEIQFVHETDDKSTIIILSVLLDVEGEDDNEFLEFLFKNILDSHAKSGTVVLEDTTSYDKFIDHSNRKWFNYQGSLSQPPCNENVDWWITAAPTHITLHQLEFFQFEHSAFYRVDHGKNTRPIQPLNGREIQPMSNIWGYNYNDGKKPPEFWKDDFPKCSSTYQSPINIPYTQISDELIDIHPTFEVTGCYDFEWFNDPDYTSLKWVHKQTAGDSCLAKGRSDTYFKLKEFYVHAPSEHQINDKPFDAEIQFLHTANGGSSLMIVSLLIEVYGINDNLFFKELLNKIDEEEDHAPVTLFNSYKDFVDSENRKWFSYLGSYTSPPCDEDVDWWVAADPIYIAQAQMDELISRQLVFSRLDRSRNNRPIQPLNGRNIRPLNHAWGYNQLDGALAQSKWYSDYPNCGGYFQSPINIPFTKKSFDSFEKIYPKIDVQGCDMFEWHNEPTSANLKWILEKQDGDVCKAKGLAGNEFDLTEIVIHAPSEHQINHISHDGEIYFYHSINGGGQLLIISLFLDVSGSEKNVFIESLLNDPKTSEDHYGYVSLNKEKSYHHFIDADNKKWFNYQGSLTTPPCTENVDWWIATEVIYISESQLRDLKSLQLAFLRTDNGKNNRFVQEIHGREIRPLDHSWAYTDLDGALDPSNWYQDYPKCGHSRQSPVDIDFVGQIGLLDKIKPFYHDECNSYTWTREKSDNMLIWKYNKDDTCLYEAKGRSHEYFKMTEFRIHSPSEHKIHHLSFDVEIHFKFYNGKGQMMFIAILFNRAKDDSIANDPLLQSFFDSIKEHKDTFIMGESFTQYIPTDSKKWFNYQGSLTTPPCTENVDWWINPEYRYITMEQYDFLLSEQLAMPKTYKGRNNRPIQSLNGRNVRPITDLSEDWAYHSINGTLSPTLWHKKFPSCDGKHQSPIDIPYIGEISLLNDDVKPKITAEGCSNFKWYNEESGTHLKWTHQSSIDATCEVVGYADTSFKLRHFYLHAPSEHKINHQVYDAEFHFVHQNEENGKFVIVSILVDGNSKKNSKFFDGLFGGFDDKESGDVVLTHTYKNFIDAENRKWFNYQGSMTAPPCTENVDWWVSPEPEFISGGQLREIIAKQLAFQRTHGYKNNRAIQPINERPIRPLYPVWAYHHRDGFIPPSQWHHKYLSCGLDNQSPIDIPYTGAISDIKDYSLYVSVEGCKEFEYHNYAKQTHLEWDIIQKENEKCEARGKNPYTYDLIGIRIHSPSEHQINGKVFDAEVHFEHRADLGRKALSIGLFLEASGEIDNPFLHELLHGMGNDDIGVETLHLSYDTFIDVDNRKWFNYRGSFTSPPCSEIVDWWISPNAIRISRSQYEFIQSKQSGYMRNDHAMNNRPIQSTNGRIIEPMSNSWAYHSKNGMRGPNEWHFEWETCAGSKQSPIDVPYTKGLHLLNDREWYDELYYSGINLPLEGCNIFEWHNDISSTGLYWNHLASSYHECTAPGKNNNLLDLSHIVVHVPSEHLINGYQSDGEIQITFSNSDDSDQLTIALLLEEDKTMEEDDPFLKDLLGGMEIGDKIIYGHDTVQAESPISEFIDAKNRNWFHYSGSMTKPPCYEIVEWWLSPNPTKITSYQFQFLVSKQAAFQRTERSRNNRPVQAVNGRTIEPLHHDWAYTNVNGALPPENWMDDYATCGGHRQSPIDLPYTADLSVLPNLADDLEISFTNCFKFHWTNKYEDTNVKWERIFEDNTACTAKGSHYQNIDYELQQFYLHAPSEHAINGKSYDAEIQFSHGTMTETKNETKLIVSLFLNADKSLESDNEFIKNAMDVIQKGEESGDATLSESYLDFINSRINNKDKWFNYMGSLTVPPCTEDIEWWIAVEPIPITPSQLDLLISKQIAFRRTNEGLNSRPLQPLYGREIRPLESDWAYHNKNGYVSPEFWYEMDNGESCEAKNLSPVNIPFEGDISQLPRIFPIVKAEDVNGVSTNQTDDFLGIQYEGISDETSLRWSLESSDSKLFLGQGIRTSNSHNSYSLSEIRVHSPSEHRLNGVQYDLELHLIHDYYSNDIKLWNTTITNYGVVEAEMTEHTQNENKKMIISLFLEIDETNENKELSEILKLSSVSKTYSASKNFISDFVNAENRHWFTYDGSQTKPSTCQDADVEWWVSAESMAISRKSYDTIISKHSTMKKVWDQSNSKPLVEIGYKSVQPVKNESREGGNTYNVVEEDYEQDITTSANLGLTIAIILVGLLTLGMVTYVKRINSNRNLFAMVRPTK